MMKKTEKILITGGAGFVGSHLVEFLKEKKFENVYITYHRNLPKIVVDLIGKDNCFSVDLTNQQEFLNLLEDIKPNYIFHLAAIATTFVSFDDPYSVFANNLKIDSNLLLILRNNLPQTRCLFIGSGAEYQLDNENTKQKVNENFPLGSSSPYGVAKTASDLLAFSFFQKFNLKIIRVRPFNHIGIRQKLGFVVPDFINQILEVKRGEKDFIEVGNLLPKRDFLDVRDLVRAYFVLMDRGEIGDVYNVGSGRSISIGEILQELMKLLNVDCEVKSNQTKLRKNEVKEIVVDNSKLRALGWEPAIPIKQTLSDIVEGVR